MPVVLVDGTDTFSPALARTLPDTPGSAPVRVVGPGEATFGHANPHLGAAGLYGGRLSMEARIPSPLHPAIVHLPIGLALAAPFFAAGAMWAIRRGVSRKKAWGLTLVILALLVVTAYIGLATGEADEHVVEAVISERLIDVHEEAGKLFFSITLGVLVAGGVGLASGSVGRTARILTLAGTIAAVVSAWVTGHTGGDLVYRHGAASVWVERQQTTRVGADGAGVQRERAGTDQREGGAQR